MKILSTNTILYCGKWKETVSFYENILGFEPLLTSDWFVEFSLGGSSRVSIADESRASIKSTGGAGITLALEVTDLKDIHRILTDTGARPGPVRKHPWSSLVFNVFDPEGHRIEFWQRT